MLKTRCTELTRWTAYLTASFPSAATPRFMNRFAFKKPSLSKFIKSRRRALKRVVDKTRNRAQKIHYPFIQRQPIERRTIFFESFRGLSYSGNPKAICDEIVAQGLPIDCVWSLKNMKTQVPRGVRKVKSGSPDYYYYHACARILIHNTDFRQNLPIRPEQTFINTQHGTPLKLMGSDMVERNPDIEGSSKRWNYFPKNGRWDYLVSPNTYTSDIFRRVFQYDGPVLEVGYPRNDLFYNKNSPEKIRSLKIRLGIPLDRKVILYAPTWRNQGASRSDKKFKLLLDLKLLKQKFERTHVVILRLHHLISASIKRDEDLEDFVFNCSAAKYDAQELMLASDLMITDYSSMMFDYSNLGRPLIFFTYDLDDYASDTRGMYFDLAKNAPGPLVKDMPALVRALETVNSWQAEYEERRLAFYEKFCSLDDGNATQKILDRVILPAMGLR